MKHCDTCLTNVGELCPHCRMCSSCCDENKCFGCADIFKDLRSIFPNTTKYKKIFDRIESEVAQQNTDSTVD